MTNHISAYIHLEVEVYIATTRFWKLKYFKIWTVGLYLAVIP